MEYAGVLSRHRTLVLVAAAGVPLLVCLVVGAISTSAAHQAALIVVGVVVAAAATGMRSVGLTAAVASALGYDFFLTAPYLNLAIVSTDDVVTTVLLLLIGIGTTELALWGRRQQGRAGQQSGYLSGVLETSAALGASTVDQQTLEQVSDRLLGVLGVDGVRYTERPPVNGSRLEADGSVVQHGRRLDAIRDGLPTDDVVVIPAGRSGSAFLITSSTRIRRLSLDQCRVAVALADQVGAALERDRTQSDGGGAVLEPPLR